MRRRLLLASYVASPLALVALLALCLAGTTPPALGICLLAVVFVSPMFTIDLMKESGTDALPADPYAAAVNAYMSADPMDPEATTRFLLAMAGEPAVLREMARAKQQAKGGVLILDKGVRYHPLDLPCADDCDCCERYTFMGGYERKVRVRPLKPAGDSSPFPRPKLDYYKRG